MNGFEYPNIGTYSGGRSLPCTSATDIKDDLKRFSEARRRRNKTDRREVVLQPALVHLTRSGEMKPNVKYGYTASGELQSVVRKDAVQGSNRTQTAPATATALNPVDLDRVHVGGEYSRNNQKKPTGEIAKDKAARAVSAGNNALSEKKKTKTKAIRLLRKSVRVIIDIASPDSKKYRAEGVKKKIPVPTMLVVVTLAVSLLLVVASSVITSKASMELASMKRELGSLQEKKEKLMTELEIKNDLVFIESMARGKLGMVDREYARVVYIGDDSERRVIILDKDESFGVGLGALLDALGFIK